MFKFRCGQVRFSFFVLYSLLIENAFGAIAQWDCDRQFIVENSATLDQHGDNENFVRLNFHPLSEDESYTSNQDSVVAAIKATQAENLENILNSKQPTRILSTVFINEDDYKISILPLYQSAHITKFIVGVLPFKPSTSPHVGIIAMKSVARGVKNQLGCQVFNCMHACIPQNELIFTWRAPRNREAICVEIRAMVSLDISPDVWRNVSHYMCRAQDLRQPIQPLAVPDCCACGSASYQINFQGHWTENSYKYMNNMKYLTEQLQWSELMGVSHSSDFILWQLQGYASNGVQDMCALGASKRLEYEIKLNARHRVLTVVKARALLNTLAQRSNAIFAVNRTHHLLSILSHFSPSPDWCVGLSAIDLCSSSCAWQKNLLFHLYPWDAGTSRLASTTKTDPQRITAIRAGDPNYKAFEAMTNLLPLATVRITRIPPFDNDRCSD